MRIISLCKRHPQARDLFTQPYGRFYHLPRLLAERGHEVHLLLLDYRHSHQAYRREGNLHWHTVPALPWGPFPYLIKAVRLTAEVKPDWILGFSDTWYGILAEHIGRKHGVRSAIDAYDNYESYIPWLKPLHNLWRRALVKADVVFAAGPQLADYMSASAGGRQVEVVPMAADPIFKPMDKLECRRMLGLPADRLLVGYAGSLHPNRGIDMLFQVFTELRAANTHIELVLSGRLAKGVALPSGVCWLGYRPANEVPVIMNSLDLMLVINKAGAFGDYSYPAKLYEALACGLPVLGANVLGTAWILKDHPDALAQAGDASDFYRKAIMLLENGQAIPIKNTGWPASADLLENTLLSQAYLGACK